MTWTLESRQWVEQAARNAGFSLAGVADVPESDSDDAQVADKRFSEWIASGHAGDMEWMKRADADGALMRADLRRPMPWARSVVVCAINYNAEASRSVEPAEPTQGWIARYAWSGKADEPAKGADYHDVLLPRLKRVETAIRERFMGCETRCYVDTGPIVERGYAERAGVGWIGKNTCVLNQREGSWLLLGVVVTSIPVQADALSIPAADRCGSCKRCIEACPTDALIAPRLMDASRCIAYLTIEKRGVIDEDLREGMGRQIFGCDICQDVCPWNRKAPIATGSAMPPRQQLINPDLEWMAALDGPSFNKLFRGSPMERTGRKRMQRNVAIAMGNSGQQEFIPRLQEWERSEDPVLAEAAAWSLRKLASKVEAA